MVWAGILLCEYVDSVCLYGQPPDNFLQHCTTSPLLIACSGQLQQPLQLVQIT